MFAISPAQQLQYRAALHDKQRRESISVLVVEDQPLLRRVLAEILHRECLIDEAENISGAWRHYLNRAHDIVFIDIGLTDGSGHDLAENIRKLEPSAHIIMATASGAPADRKTAEHNRTNGYITKPYTRQIICDHVAAYRLRRTA